MSFCALNGLVDALKSSEYNLKDEKKRIRNCII